MRRVAVPANAGPAISAAMELVAGTYALIVDLRHNGGGAPEGVAFWCSYLLTEQPTHLNDIFHADTGETRQFWALPYVPGTRYLDRPVYVLTSSHTFSGGEDFCYTLQALGRAKLIGQTTGGGAHPTRGTPISPAVHIGIPFARSINPITGTNWQGTGVVPDIAVPEAEACDVAYALALRYVLALHDLFPHIEDEARDALAGLPAAASVRAESAVADPAVTESPAPLRSSGIAECGTADARERGYRACRKGIWWRARCPEQSSTTTSPRPGQLPARTASPPAVASLGMHWPSVTLPALADRIDMKSLR